MGEFVQKNVFVVGSYLRSIRIATRRADVPGRVNELGKLLREILIERQHPAHRISDQQTPNRRRHDW